MYRRTKTRDFYRFREGTQSKTRFYPTGRVTGPPSRQHLAQKYKKEGLTCADVYIDARMSTSKPPVVDPKAPKTPKGLPIISLMDKMGKEKVKVNMYVEAVIVSTYLFLS